MKPLCFVLDSAASDRTPKAILKGDWQCRRAGDTRLFQRRYLDSLDWRLLRAGRYLIADQFDGGWQLRLFSLCDHAQLADANVAQLPVFLPARGLAAMNAPLHEAVGRRALVSQLQLAVTRHPLAVVDDRGTVVAHLDLEYNEPSGPADKPGVALDRRLWFIPVAGDEGQHRNLVDTLSRHALPVSGAVIPITEVIAALRLDTGRFDPQPRLVFEPDQPCERAVRRLLAFFLDVMEANRPALIDDVDTECLHDFRVAVRRSRSLLGQLRKAIPASEAKGAEQLFAKLNRVTNRQRDLDVMLLNFDFYRSLLPAAHRTRLDPVYAAVVDQRQAAWAATVRLLNSAEYRRFASRWRGYLGAEAPSKAAGDARPVKEAAGARIWKLYKRILAEGGAITGASPPEALHALRKRCKTLRYMIEFFASLYSEDKLKKALKVMKRLQDNLGDYQDLYVHGALLAEMRRRLADHALLLADTQAALVTVGEALERRAASCRQRFHKRFGTFANEAHRRQFKRLFKP